MPRPAAASFWPVALPLAALVALPLISSGRPAIEPLSLAGLLAIVLCAIGAGARPWVAALAAAAIGFCAQHLWLLPGLPFGHDLVPHLWGMWGFLQEIGGGDVFPRWLHQLGLGAPLPMFYGPLPLYAALPFHWLGWPTYAALESVFVLAGGLGALAMFSVVRRWTDDPRAALVAGTAYAFAPYRLLDANYRLALGESVAFVVLPLALDRAFEAAREGGRERWRRAALLWALLILVHPLSTLMAALALGVWIAVANLTERRGGLHRELARAVGAAAVGVCAAGFFTLPLLVESGATSLRRSAEYPNGAAVIAEHGLRPEQLLERRLWTVLRFSVPSAAEDPAREDDEMPFYFGMVLLSLVPLGAGAGHFETTARRRGAALGLAALAAFALVATLEPSARLLAHLPGLGLLQFSWRFAAVATIACSGLAGLAAARILAACSKGWMKTAVAAAFAGALVVDGFPFTGAAEWVPAYRGVVRFHRPEADCGRGACLRMETIAPPLPERVAGQLFLPPAEATPNFTSIHPDYPEYFNPTALDHLTAAEGVALANWGAGLVGRLEAPGVERLLAAPYARWTSAVPAAAGTVTAGVARPSRRGGGHIEVDLVDPAGAMGPGSILLLEQWFPGWQVDGDGGWRDVEPSAEGLLVAAVAAGQERVRFRFDPWRWDRLGGWALSAVTLVGLSVGGARRWRNRQGR